MKLSRALAGAGTVAVATAAAVAVAAPAAHAELLCREVSLEDYSVAVACVLVEPNHSGTTVAPVVWIGCTFADGTGMCAMDPVSLGRTGLTLSSTLPTIQVDPATLTVYSDGGYVGTIWVNGKPVNLNLPGFCLGDPAIC